MFTFDKTGCTGCGACILACMDAHTPDPAGPGVQYRRLGQTEGEREGRPYVRFEVLSCRHCQSPACRSVCPAEAIFITPQGFVRVDAEKCIRCGACAGACPFDAIVPEENGPVKCPGCEERYCEQACSWEVIKWK